MSIHAIVRSVMCDARDPSRVKDIGHMPKGSTCFWCEKNVAAAVRVYVSIVPHSRIDHVQPSLDIAAPERAAAG